jgi:hypothetical protein
VTFIEVTFMQNLAIFEIGQIYKQTKKISSNIHESPLAKKTYDFIFSLGENCLCASRLKASLLREYSCPFDWVSGTTNFGQRIYIILNEFSGYFEKDKLELRERLFPYRIFYANI